MWSAAVSGIPTDVCVPCQTGWSAGAAAIAPSQHESEGAVVKICTRSYVAGIDGENVEFTGGVTRVDDNHQQAREYPEFWIDEREQDRQRARIRDAAANGGEHGDGNTGHQRRRSTSNDPRQQMRDSGVRAIERMQA